jgi:hypothetical protein
MEFARTVSEDRQAGLLPGRPARSIWTIGAEAAMEQCWWLLTALEPCPSLLNDGTFYAARPGWRMEALLTAIALWLSINFPLPANLNHPAIKFVSAAEMIAPLNKNQLRTSDVSASEISSDIVSLYSNESKTIFLLDGWTGKTPAELSILVHEMVHHLQNVGQLKFACPEEREELAYKAQDSWLHLFGRDLESEFQMDPFTILVKSKCL